MCMPSSCGRAVSGAYTVTQWPIMVATCITVHRVDGVRFERVTLWIRHRGFFAQGQGYTTVSRAHSVKRLFLALPDNVVRNREEEKTLLKDAFQPPPDATKALDHMRDRSPAAVEVDTGRRVVQYVTLRNSSGPYLSPALWTGVWATIAQPRGTYALNS